MICLPKYNIDVMGCGIVTVEADTLNEAKYLINSGYVKIPYQRYVHEWYTCCRVIDKEKPRKIELSWKLRGWICPTCRWGTNYDNKRCDFCGQRLLPPYEFMEDKPNGTSFRD